MKKGGNAMIKMNILNMKGFLNVVNLCSGNVIMRNQDGSKENIRLEKRTQEELWRKFNENKGILPIQLEIPACEDYLRVVYFFIADN